MKNILFILVAFILFSFRKSEKPTEYLNVKGPLTFNHEIFEFVWSEKSGDYYIQEYLPVNDTLEHFDQLISLFVLNADVPINDAIKLKEQELEELKKNDPVCNYITTVAPKNKGIVIDFLVSESDGEYLTKIEFNAYRFKQISIGKNKKAILVYAYSKRAYGMNITPFLQTLGEKRKEYLENIFNVEIPEINLVNN